MRRAPMMMRALIPHAGLVVFPACGHTPNIEEPGLFNLHVVEAEVESAQIASDFGKELFAYVVRAMDATPGAPE